MTCSNLVLPRVSCSDLVLSHVTCSDLVLSRVTSITDLVLCGGGLEELDGRLGGDGAAARLLAGGRYLVVRRRRSVRLGHGGAGNMRARHPLQGQGSQTLLVPFTSNSASATETDMLGSNLMRHSIKEIWRESYHIP